MALVKSVLAKQLETIFADLSDKTPAEAAEKIASAIDSYIKSAAVTTTVAVTTPAGAGTGTGTGSLS